MPLADRDGNADLVCPGVVGVLRPAQIRDQRLDHGAVGNHFRQQQRPLDDLLGIRQLRDHARRHEAANLDFPHAGGSERGDPGQFVIGGHPGLGDLQPVARAHFDDLDLAAHLRNAL